VALVKWLAKITRLLIGSFLTGRKSIFHSLKKIIPTGYLPVSPSWKQIVFI